MSIVKSIHRSLFLSVLHEQRDYRITEYNGKVTVKITSNFKNTELTVRVKFNSKSDISETTVDLSTDSTRSCSYGFQGGNPRLQSWEEADNKGTIHVTIANLGF